MNFVFLLGLAIAILESIMYYWQQNDPNVGISEPYRAFNDESSDKGPKLPEEVPQDILDEIPRKDQQQFVISDIDNFESKDTK